MSSLDDWRRLVSSTFLPLDATVDGDERFRGWLEGVANDQMAVIRVGSVAQHVSRSAAACRRSRAEFLKVLVQRSGDAVVEQDGHHGTHTENLFTTGLSLTSPASLAWFSGVVAGAWPGMEAGN